VALPRPRLLDREGSKVLQHHLLPALQRKGDYVTRVINGPLNQSLFMLPDLGIDVSALLLLGQVIKQVYAPD
jgi:hypothetical protein